MEGSSDSVAGPASHPMPDLDLDVVDDARRHREGERRRRARAALGVAATVTLVWAIYVTAAGHWGRVVDNWVATVTMVFGSFVAGSTPQGGGAVAFPVFTKGIQIPADVARTFSLCIQTIGMGAAAASILVQRRHVEARAVLFGAPVAVATFLLGLFLLGEPDQPFWPSKLPGPYVKITFTIIVASMAVMVYLGSRVPVREVVLRIHRNARTTTVVVIGAAIGGVASSLVGSGADVLVYLALVVLLGLDTRVAVPTSVLIMATVSVAGMVTLGVVDGQLAVGLGADGVTSLGGAAVAATGTGPAFGAGPPLPADRFDLFGLWLAAVPVVAWFAPLGAEVASRMSARALVLFVAALAMSELVTTVVFVEELRSDPWLAVYGVVGLAAVFGGLMALSRARSRLFALPGVDAERTLRRHDLDVRPGYRSALDGEEEER